jgi:hypothetical protein
MDIKLILEPLVTLGALAMGTRAGGLGLGLWGAVGLPSTTPVVCLHSDCQSGVTPRARLARKMCQRDTFLCDAMERCSGSAPTLGWHNF